MQKAESGATEWFDCIELGVGVSIAAKAIIHSAKITYEKILNADSKEGVHQIDYRNAFNLVKRSHSLQAACNFIQGIAAFKSFCYSQNVPLLYKNASLQKESDVHRGDSLGPLLFSLTLWSVLEIIRDAVPNLKQHTLYFDDGFVAGSEDQIRTTPDILANEVPKRGLYLRKDKCEIWSIVDLPSADREVTRNTGNCLEVLGATVGSTECVSSCLQKLVQKVVLLLENSNYLDDPLCALAILRFCLGTPKIFYSRRINTLTKDVIDVLKVFEFSQRDALGQILGTVTYDNAWKQSTLPINNSGLEVRQSQEQHRAAYVGSVLASDDVVQKITNQRASESGELFTSLEPFNLTSYTQKKSQEIVDTGNFSELLINQSPNSEKARLQSLCLLQSGAWLVASPVPALCLHLSPSEFHISVKYKLGIAVYEDERKCPYCRSWYLDIFGDHVLICHGRGDAISRHEMIRDSIESACSAAILSPVNAKRNHIAVNISRPGDKFLPSLKSGRPAVIDVTVTSPLHPNIINHAAEKSGYAIVAAEERKYAQHEKNCSERGILFVPLAVESLGGLSVTLKKALKRIALLAVSRNYQSQGHAIAFDRLAQSVFVVIVRGSATTLLARVP